MDWNKYTATKDEVYNMMSVMQIKYDCETIYKLVPCIRQNPIILMSALPYLTLFCTSLEEYICKTQGIKIEENTEIDMSDVRSTIKLFEGRYGRTKNTILQADRIQDEEFNKQLRFSFFYKFKLYYNIGIYFNDSGHIICNTQQLYYSLQDRKYTKSLGKKALFNYAERIGAVIGSAQKGLAAVKLFYLPRVHAVCTQIYYKDLNTNKANFNKFVSLNDGKELTLRLLHILSSVNYVKYILFQFVDNQNMWQFRIKYCIFYSAVISIKQIISKSDNYYVGNSLIATSLKSMINDADSLMDGIFRNCMMHYSFENKGKYAVEDKYLDLTLPLFGLVESRFEGLTFSELSSLIDSHIDNISIGLEQILKIDNSKMEII